MAGANPTPTFRRGDPAARAPAGAAVAADLLCTRAEFLRLTGISNGCLAGAQQRGQVPVVKIGARTFIALAQWHLSCLGVQTPRQLGELAAGLDVDLAGLLRFLSGDGREAT